MATHKQFYIIGDPVSHSVSPRVYRTAFNSHNLVNYNYDTLQVSKDALEKSLQMLREQRVSGFSVTMPHKEAIIPYLDEVDEIARTIGAVNTVKSVNGKLVGSNTDWLGILGPLTNASFSSAVVLGAGGTAKAAIIALKHLNIEKIYVHNRTKSRAEMLAKQFEIYAGLPESTNLIVNTTPVGMGSLAESSPIAAEYIQEHMVVFDAVYFPERTQLLIDAEKAGATTIFGKEMFAYQAQAQIKALVGVTLSVAEIQESLK